MRADARRPRRFKRGVRCNRFRRAALEMFFANVSSLSMEAQEFLLHHRAQVVMAAEVHRLSSAASVSKVRVLAIWVDRIGTHGYQNPILLMAVTKVFIKMDLKGI